MIPHAIQAFSIDFHHKAWQEHVVIASSWWRWIVDVEVVSYGSCMFLTWPSQVCANHRKIVYILWSFPFLVNDILFICKGNISSSFSSLCLLYSTFALVFRVRSAINWSRFDIVWSVWYSSKGGERSIHGDTTSYTNDIGKISSFAVSKGQNHLDFKMAPSVDSATRKKVLRVVFISLLLDLVSLEAMYTTSYILTSPRRSVSVWNPA